jgi:hypothetical protein
MEKLSIDIKKAKSIISASSASGRYALFGFLQSYKKNIAFDKNKFPVETYSSSSDYFYGYIVAFYAFGLLDFNYKESIITPTYFDSVLAEQLENYLNEKKLTDIKVKERVEKINKYFS